MTLQHLYEHSINLNILVAIFLQLLSPRKRPGSTDQQVDKFQTNNELCDLSSKIIKKREIVKHC